MELMFDLEPEAYGVPKSLDSRSVEMKYVWRKAIQ